MMTHFDLNDSQIDVLSVLYAEASCTLDDLPYTAEFVRLYSQFLARAGVSLDRHEGSVQRPQGEHVGSQGTLMEGGLR